MLFQMYLSLMKGCVKWFQKMSVYIFSRGLLVYCFSSKHLLHTMTNHGFKKIRIYPASTAGGSAALKM